jgi:NADPH:quinone reductase-like Zn-dependent oxidoreductase
MPVVDDVTPTMLAALLTRHGGPDAVELRDVAVPRPGPGQVLVRVGAAGCNNTDLWTREGTYGLSGAAGAPAGWKGPLDLPRIQGGDVAGRVVTLGGAVDPDLVGARVLVDPALYDGPGDGALVDDVLGSERDGGFAEYVVVPAERAHRVDDSPLSDVELGALPIAYGTALGMLERGSVAEGDTVLVTGASGGVGLAATQLARARGARVVAVSTGATSAQVLAAGADEVVDRDRGRVLSDAGDASRGGFDAVIDVVAGDLVTDGGVDLLRPGGRWVVAGALGGSEVSLDVRALYLRNRSLVGSTMHTPRVFAELVALARSGAIRPVIAGTFPLTELHEAHRRLEGRRDVGKLVVVPGPR